MVWKRRKWNGRNGKNGKRIIYAMLVDEIKNIFNGKWRKYYFFFIFSSAPLLS